MPRFTHIAVESNRSLESMATFGKSRLQRGWRYRVVSIETGGVIALHTDLDRARKHLALINRQFGHLYQLIDTAETDGKGTDDKLPRPVR